ncbi:hypothetical protein ROTAS13_02963 [Roseomonas sp. TAS13]|uniref:hypothetical protein n=1 Tax=Roseomonas TaxID=125216 RepID=UPI000961A8C8|nr:MULTISPECIES: hypothetical protein [Roseomonas]MCG7351433.1 hypothetical protein [Roseomonas mucosa]MCG7358092.1 hypothetical protein [Roseomonas mucosa]GAV35288.1 hypothetical protein ROTAS13_02963 [Roseomonas sp. TAS13]
MLLRELRGHKALTGLLAGANSAARIDTAPQWDPDGKLLADCKALESADAAYHEGVRRIGSDLALENEDVVCQLAELDRERVVIAERIATTPALSCRGVRYKLAVIERLLPQRYEDPAPKRDAVLLSFLLDVDRLCYARAGAGRAKAFKASAAARAIIATSEVCVRLIERIAAGIAQMDKEDLAPEQLDELAETLSDTLQEKREVIAALAEMPARSFHTAQAKATVLRRLLETGSLEDGHCGRVDLSRSYIADISRLLAENDVDCAAAAEVGS